MWPAGVAAAPYTPPDMSLDPTERLEALRASHDPAIVGIAAKIDREEAYHRMHAEMWIDRLLSTEEGRSRLNEAIDELWPYALGVLAAVLLDRPNARHGSIDTPP